MPIFMSPPAGMPEPRRVIGPTIDDIWFIMWCGRWQCSIQSPGLFATNSISLACATPTSSVFPGMPRRLRNPAAFRSGDVERVTMNVNRMMIHAKVDQADADTIAKADDQRRDGWPGFAVE